MWCISLIPDGGNNVIKSVANNDFTSDDEIPSFFANSIYECENIGQLIKFYHATMGYPVTSTWRKAIDAGYFQGWPSLTSARVRKFIKIVPETEMGHLDQRKVGIRSTRATQETREDPDSMTPVPQAPNNDKPIMCTWLSQNLRASSSVIKQAASQSHSTKATVM